jgi:hypothetical protein
MGVTADFAKIPRRLMAGGLKGAIVVLETQIDGSTATHGVTATAPAIL